MMSKQMWSKKVQSTDLKSGRLLGKGASSIVYETTWKGEIYARKDFLRVPSDIFEREAVVLVGLDHPNIARTYCWTIDEGSCSLVLELMDDDLLNMMQRRKASQRKKCPPNDASQTSHLIDLHKFIEDGKNAPVGTASESVASPLIYPFNMAEALQIMLQIAEGMKFLHDKGVVHGDLKPKNILVTPSGMAVSGSLDQNVAINVKVADFGLAWTKMKSRALVSRQARNLEMVRWRAPELLDLSSLRRDEDESSTDSDWDSDSIDGKIGVHVHEFTYYSDVYNFAFTCSQILTGEDPYPGLGLNDLVRKTPLGLRPELPSTCPAQLSDLIERCWGENAGRPTFHGILSELKDVQASLMADSLVDIKETVTESSLERTESQQSIFEPVAISRQSSERPEISSNFSPGSEMDQKVDVPVGDEIPDSSKGTFVLKQRRKQRRRSRKAFSCLGNLGCIPTKAMRSKKNEDIPMIRTPPERSSWLKRRAQNERKKNPFAAWKMFEDGEAPKLKEVRWFSFHDIKRMTNNFNEDNVLGDGGYGKVYKGILADTGAAVAVKRARDGSRQGAREFKNEIELLSRVHHNNLVGLVGYCFEKAERTLVYEYLPNGSLTDWLRGSRSYPPLDWDRRLRIALGASRGLAYLHDNADPPIIHRDVKSDNILLDKTLNAKVADFGLSLTVPDEKTGEIKQTIMGTMGYLDPEYYCTSVMSTKSDVYSFGVVLLEIITAKPPIFRGGSIVREVRNRYVDRLGLEGVKEILDPALTDTHEEELEIFLDIALNCVEDTSLQRPSMHEVVKELEALVGAKGQLMPGREISVESKMTKRGKQVPGEISNAIPIDFEPASGQLSQESSGSWSPMWPTPFLFNQSKNQYF